MLRRNGANQWVGEETPYDLSFFLPGTYSNSALMAQVVLDRAVTLPDELTGAQGYAGITATASTVLDLQRNGANIGTITFTSAGNTGSFAMQRRHQLRPG